MKLRIKATLLLSVFIIFSFVVLILSVNSILKDAARELQVKDMTHDGIILRNAVESRLDSIDAINMDWASWDDTYGFVKDNNTEYLSSNLNDETIANLHLSHIFIFDESGRPVILRSVDHEQGVSVSLTLGFAEQFTPGSPFLVEGEEDARRGYIVRDGVVYAFAARPILTSKGEGPYRGTIIFIMPFDEEAIAHISERTNTSVILRTSGPSDQPIVFSQSLGDDAVVLRQMEGEDALIMGQTRITDVYGSQFILEYVSEQTPDQFASAASKLSVLTLVLAVTGFVLWLVIVLSLEFVIIRRLRDIELFVNAAKSIGTVPMLNMSGDDEISTLSRNVNDLFSDIYRQNKELMEKNDTLKLAIAPMPFERLRKQVIADFDARFAGKAMLKVEPSTVVIRADERKLGEACASIISTAVAYGGEGLSISMVCVHEGKDVVITIEDNGRGIPIERLPNLFSSPYGSHGDEIGLPQAKHIIEKHGGTVKVTSERGTKFTITLPWV